METIARTLVAESLVLQFISLLAEIITSRYVPRE